MQVQISWLLQKPTDLDLHCLQRQGISGVSRTRVKRTMNAVKSTLFPLLNNSFCATFSASLLGKKIMSNQKSLSQHKQKLSQRSHKCLNCTDPILWYIDIMFSYFALKSGAMKTQLWNNTFSGILSDSIFNKMPNNQLLTVCLENTRNLWQTYI